MRLLPYMYGLFTHRLWPILIWAERRTSDSYTGLIYRIVFNIRNIDIFDDFRFGKHTNLSRTLV